MTYVVDASVVVAFLTGGATEHEEAVLRGTSDAPALLDVEVMSAIRGLLRGGRLDLGAAGTACRELRELAVVRRPMDVLLPRAWELRDRCTTYDALYVALAEHLDATLVTRDERLARAVAGLVAVRTG